MRGVVFPGDRRAEVRDYPDPEPGPGEVVVRMKASGLCGSDLHLYRQTAAQRAGNDTIPGHEPSGVVEMLGAGVDTVRVGDRVSVYHYRGCGHCKHCRAGNVMWCAERRGYGGPIHGADADLLLTDARNCMPLPDELSFAHGALMACAAGTAFSSMRKLQASGEDTLVIFGQGPVGLCGLLVAKAMGGRVIGVDPIPERRALALRLGADAALDPSAVDVREAIRDLTHGEGADLAFETSGSAAGQNGAVDCLRLGGKAVFVGFGVRGKTLNPSQFIGRQLTLMGSFVIPIYMYDDLAQFILDHNLPLEEMVTHRFSLEEAPQAFALFDQGATGKVILEWA
ncbi:MAG TPA: zinc-binding dehydrogenase [Anaerolineae bacterium]|nr:zinc-binding dehydrogenase [Anaerolineae bacterium]